MIKRKTGLFEPIKRFDDSIRDTTDDFNGMSGNGFFKPRKAIHDEPDYLLPDNLVNTVSVNPINTIINDPLGSDNFDDIANVLPAPERAPTVKVNNDLSLLNDDISVERSLLAAADTIDNLTKAETVKSSMKGKAVVIATGLLLLYAAFEFIRRGK